MAIQVLKLTQAQKDALIDPETGKGIKYNSFAHFNPVLDADGNWFISKEEEVACDHNTVGDEIHEWIHSLPEIDHNPVIVEI